MKSAFETIKQNAMFKSGENIGVACSGGSDSICLLHFLNCNKSLKTVAKTTKTIPFNNCHTLECLDDFINLFTPKIQFFH